MTQTFLRLGDVQRVTGLTRSTIYDMVSKGEFPKQVLLGARAVGWVENEVAEWQRKKVANRDQAAA